MNQESLFVNGENLFVNQETYLRIWFLICVLEMPVLDPSGPP